MNKSKEILLARLKKLEAVRAKNKCLLPAMALFMFSCSGYIFYLYNDTTQKILICNTDTERILLLYGTQVMIVLCVLFFLVGMYGFIHSLDAWVGSPEREAIIKILEDTIENNKVASGNTDLLRDRDT